MKSAIVNLGCIVSGDWRKPLVDGDAILMEGDKLAKVGSVSDADLKGCDLDRRCQRRHGLSRASSTRMCISPLAITRRV